MIIAWLLSIASFSTAAVLFLDTAPKTSSARTTPQSPVEMKWGEGSEAGVPDTTAAK
jgi:hypothetical protein